MLFASSAHAQLKVLQPSTLAAEIGDGTGTIDASLGNFGHITYGQTIIGTVVYPTPWDPSTATAASGQALA